MSGTTVRLCDPLAHDHANGEEVIDPAQLTGERLGRMLGNAQFRTNRAVSGAALVKGGVPTVQGGFNAPFQLHPKPAQVVGAYTECAVGTNLCMWGLNDVSDANLTAAGSTAIYQAWRQAMRAVLARFSLSLMWEGEAAFSPSATNTTYTSSGGSAGTNGGSWAVTSTTAGNSGTGYRSTTATGDKVIHSLPAGWAGPAGSPARYVDICFLGNYVGGSIPASQISFTVDGVAAYPVGSNASGAYSVSNPFSTVDQNPAVFGTAVPCVARLLVTPTGNAQTIVASAGAGGMAVDWVGYEANQTAPVVWAGVCTTPGATAQTTAAIPGLNTVSQAVIAEFSSPLICYVDMYTALSPAGVPVAAYWTNSVDTTHPNTVGARAMATEMFKAFQRLPFTVEARANL